MGRRLGRPLGQPARRRTGGEDRPRLAPERPPRPRCRRRCRRAAGTAASIATLVGFGCHTVSVGMDVPLYSSDFPGAMRLALQAATGGEAVFFQGAAGNVNPMCAFCSDEAEARRMGERLALEAMHSLADRPAWPRRLVSRADASLVPMINFRFEDAPDEAPTLSAAEERLTFPLLPVPSLAEARVLAAEYAAAARASRGARRRPGRAPGNRLPRQMGERPGRGPRGGRRREQRRGAGQRRQDRRWRDRLRPRRGLHGDRPGRAGALARAAHALQRLHERRRELLRDERGVRRRWLRAGVLEPNLRRCRHPWPRAATGCSSSVA